jgi:hypothetical protein
MFLLISQCQSQNVNNLSPIIQSIFLENFNKIDVS